MKIRLIGQRNDSGIGNHYASFCDALKQVRVIGDLVEEIDSNNQLALMQAVSASESGDINISFVAMNIHEHFRGHNVQWIVFESTKIPEHILNVLRPADQVWVPSHWGRDVLINNGINSDRIWVVPEGIDSKRFHPYGRELYGQDRPFRFLSVGKYEERKSFDETLQAFAQVFGNTPEVELIIKSSYFIDQDLKSQTLQKKINDLGLTNVTVIWGTVEHDQVADLYRGCDVFVFPTKGEGWGFPLIEAAASGMPIITIPYSGHTEFLNAIPDSVVGVDYVLAPITCTEYQSYYPDANGDWGLWARPDVYSIAEAMRQAQKNYSILSERALKNSAKIRNQFSWTQSVDQALVAMESLTRF
jgi:glycosyltransferase involved in cell wall biosynthesis